MSKEQYQKIYEEEDWYGNASIDRCPATRLCPVFINYVESPAVDLGCGRGHLVEMLRNKGIKCEGYDQIDLNNGMNVADITSDLKISGKTVTCIDCIEHIPDEDLVGLFNNFKKFKTQIFSIHNGQSMLNGVDLHINKKPFSVWDEIIKSKGFTILEGVDIQPNRQKLYITNYNE